MSSQNKTIGNMPLNCPECDAAVRKTASKTYICTGCGSTSKAYTVR